jgi:hypothetical protein
MSAYHPQFTALIEGSPASIFDLIADLPNYGRWLPRSSRYNLSQRGAMAAYSLRVLKLCPHLGLLQLVGFLTFAGKL